MDVVIAGAVSLDRVIIVDNLSVTRQITNSVYIVAQTSVTPYQVMVACIREPVPNLHLLAWAIFDSSSYKGKIPTVAGSWKDFDPTLEGNNGVPSADRVTQVRRR